MTRDSFILGGYDGSKLFVRTWIPEVEIKGTLHILHGLGEHSERYDDFARYMTRQGFAVWCHDHRQHGRSIAHDDVGIFDKKDTWEAIVEDVHTVQRKMAERYEGLPLFMLGHSMGSLILRSYLQVHPTDISGAVIMGSPVSSGLLANIGIIAAKVIHAISGLKRSKLLDKLALGSYNNAVKNSRTPYDWISHDEHIVDLYAEDPLCGYVYSPLFYGALAGGSIMANDTGLMKAFPEVPVLIISGQEDPCGLNGRGVRQLSETYERVGVSNELVLMDGMRHEVLNEIDRRDTFHLLGDWYVSRLNEEE